MPLHRTDITARALLALFWLLAAVAAPAADATVDPAAEQLAAWEITAERAEQVLDQGQVSAPALEALRGTLAEQRSDALEYQVAAGKKVAALNRQLLALGPEPKAGEPEAEDIAAQRIDLKTKITEARVPVTNAASAYQRADDLIARLNALAREQFTRRLISVGPSPLVPAYWGQPLVDLGKVSERIAKEIGANMASPAQKRDLIQRLPMMGLLVAGGLVLVIWARRGILRRVEETLRRKPDQRTAFWLASLMNVTRLLLPALGAAALLWAVQLSDLAGATGKGIVELLPPIALVMIAASWVGNSVFSPNLPQQRLLEVDDAQARSGRRLSIALGAVVALAMLLDLLGRQTRMTAESLAVLNLPLVLAAGYCMFRLSQLLRPKPSAPAAHDGAEAAIGEGLAESLLLNLSRLLVVISIAAPLLSMAGYYAASRFLTFPPILSLGLLGAMMTLFVLIREGTSSLYAPAIGQPEDEPVRQGLLPVFIGFLLITASLPILALIWGARWTDLSEIWVWLRDGIPVGGVRVSLPDMLAFVVIFGIGYSATRLLQKVARTTVLPRTKLDIGGRNALLTGIGYLGYFLSAVLAISATGLDLSNIAILAGALSVGIGFGLQTIVSNFVSGIILLIERPIKDGDWIEITNFSGYVRKISVRSTRIETFDKASVIVPNSELITKTVLNRTHSGNTGRVRLTVHVAASADPRRVEEALQKIAANHPMVMRSPSPQVLLMGIADPHEYEVRVHIRNITYLPQVTSDLNFEFVKALADPALVPPAADPGFRLSNAEAIAAALAALRALPEPAAPRPTRKKPAAG